MRSHRKKSSKYHFWLLWGHVVEFVRRMAENAHSVNLFPPPSVPPFSFNVIHGCAEHQNLYVLIFMNFEKLYRNHHAPENNESDAILSHDSVSSNDMIMNNLKNLSRVLLLSSEYSRACFLKTSCEYTQLFFQHIHNHAIKTL